MAIKSIGIDIREADGTGAGKGRYCEEITRALIDAAPHHQFYLFTNRPNPNFPNEGRVQQIVIPGRRLAWHFNLRRYLIHQPVDCFLATTSFIYPAIAPASQRVALVIHDLIAFLHAKHHHWFPTWVERLTLGRALKKSQLLICVSENTARDLARLRPKATATPTLIAYPAVSPEIRKTDRRSLDLPQRFLLAVGTLLPRKNIHGVIAAFRTLADQHPQLHLVIAGGKGWKSSQLRRAIPKALRPRIHFLGYVPYAQLTELYSRAQMLVYPSFYEGFGIPPLEAMACECPVITSNTASLPEVVADAALTVDPHDTPALTEAIKTLLSPQAQTIYKRRGLKRATHFSWKRSAKRILEAL